MSAGNLVGAKMAIVGASVAPKREHETLTFRQPAFTFV